MKAKAGATGGKGGMSRKAKAAKGAEGPKRSVAGGFGSVTRPTPGGGRKQLGPNKSKAALMALAKETAYKKPKKRGK
jgi:hypothetical protein